MRLGRASAYALQSMIYLAEHSAAGSVNVNDIALASGIPLQYLRKIMQLLVRAKLVRSERGRRGGFVLAVPAQRITMLQIVEAIEGPIDEDSIVDSDVLNEKVAENSNLLRHWRRQTARQMCEILAGRVSGTCCRGKGRLGRGNFSHPITLPAQGAAMVGRRELQTVKGVCRPHFL